MLIQESVTVAKGYNYAEPVTVTVKEDGLISFCNHAGAEPQEVVFEYPIGNISTGDIDMKETIKHLLVCDKCGMYRNEMEEWCE